MRHEVQPNCVLKIFLNQIVNTSKIPKKYFMSFCEAISGFELMSPEGDLGIVPVLHGTFIVSAKHTIGVCKARIGFAKRRVPCTFRLGSLYKSN